MVEEYRAAATIDIDHDAHDRSAEKTIECPVLALWAKGGAVDAWYKDAGGPLAIWKTWANDLAGKAVDGGHFFPEKNPIETASHLRAFMARSRRS